MSIVSLPLARKLGAFVALSEQELAALEVFHERRRTLDPGVDLVRQGQPGQSAFILADGWVCSYKLLSSGARQVVDFQVPGDFLGLRSVLFRTSDHSVESLTRVEVAEVLAKDLIDVFANTPRLATAVLWAASRDEAMVVEHLVDIGRRSALARTAHFLLELGARLNWWDLGTREGYACPLSQSKLADALGLSGVHINRILRQLRERGLLTFRSGQVIFDDFEGLVEVADFDTAYLDQDGPMLRQ